MSSNLSQIEYEDRMYDGVNQPNVVNFVKETIIDNLECALESLGRKLNPQFGEEAVKEFVATILGAYRTALQNRSKEIEKTVSEYFAISASIVHPDDQIHDELADDEEARLDRQTEAEERKYLALCVMERNMKNILSNMLRDQEGLSKLLNLSHAAQELHKNSQLLVSSLDHLPLHQILSNMSLYPN